MDVQTTDSVTLSYAQERLWVVDRLMAGSVAYNMPKRLWVRGGFDVDAWRWALERAVARHEVLRTRFVERGGVPVGVVEEVGRFEVPRVVLDRVPVGREDPVLVRVLEQEARRPFDLGCAPLVRCSVVSWPVAVGEVSECVVLLTLHHIVCDAWSLGVLARELVTLYEARVGGSPDPLAPLTVQYADLALRERTTDVQEHLEFWRSQLEGTAEVLDLPMDRPRPAVATDAGGHAYFDLGVELTELVAGCARRARCTPYMVLLAVFQVLAHRYTGVDDVVVGSPTAGRTELDSEDLIGFFVNMVPMRARLGGNPRFADVLGQVRDTVLDTREHEALSFDRLVAELRPNRTLSFAPVFQLSFVYRDDAGPIEIGGTTIEQTDTLTGTSKYDLSLFAWRGGESLAGAVEFSTDLFDGDRVERLLGHYRELLGVLCADPGVRIGDVDLLTDGERRELVGWAGSVGDGSAGLLHELVERAVVRFPERAAVVAGGVVLTYRELDERANAWAGHLRGLGVGVDDVVGVLLDRSVDLVVAVLAVLKAGAGYLPLDPDYPEERLGFMVGDARPRLLLTSGDHLVTAAGFAGGCPWVAMDAVEPVSCDGGPGVVVHPDACAYVIYTSGSTGRPKGAVNTHRAITNHMRWLLDTVQVGPGDRVLQKATHSFDASLLEMFTALASGAELHLVDAGLARDLGGLARYLRDTGITVAHFLPSVLRLFLDEPAAGEVESLRYVFLGGEVMPADLARQFEERYDARLLNLYGPSECAVDVSWWDCRIPEEGSDSVPIGRPISNVRLHLLDGFGLPVPVGVDGQVYIEGAALGRGYLADPRMTARSFVPAPWSVSGERLYRTGDVARRNRDGSLTFRGRADRQLKLRGFRIQPGEVTAAIESHPAVRRAYVAGHRDQLVAAYLADREVPELRATIGAILPRHLLPDILVRASDFPRTAGGKIDEEALIASCVPARDGPETADRGSRVGSAADGSGLVAVVLCRLLDVAAVDPDATFFNLGLNSLLMMRFRHELQVALGTTIGITDLFEHPSVSELTDHLRVEGSVPK